MINNKACVYSLLYLIYQFQQFWNRYDKTREAKGHPSGSPPAITMT